MSIGQILDKFNIGEITKQQAVTKLQRNRNRHAAQEANKAIIRFLENADNVSRDELLAELTADKEQA